MCLLLLYACLLLLLLELLQLLLLELLLLTLLLCGCLCCISFGFLSGAVLCHHGGEEGSKVAPRLNLLGIGGFGCIQ